MTKEELNKILELHRLWLLDPITGIRANLYGANLSRADLYGANLSRADLSRANLYGANLSGADLSRANLEGTNLERVSLSGADLSAYSIVPEEGPFYCYKKLRGGIVATLYVPRSAKRINSLIGRKCRVSKVKVIALSNGDLRGFSNHDPKYTYEIGKWVTPDSFNDDIRLECTNGIHVFITKKEAEDY